MDVQATTFSGNSPDSAPVLLEDNRETDGSRGVFYSDDLSSDVEVCTYEGPDQYSTAPPCEEGSAVDSLGPEDSGRLLNTSSLWFQNTLQVGLFEFTCELF